MLPDEVEERLRQQSASLDDADPADLLDDVEAAGLAGRAGRDARELRGPTTNSLSESGPPRPGGPPASVSPVSVLGAGVVSAAPDDVGRRAVLLVRIAAAAAQEQEDEHGDDEATPHHAVRLRIRPAGRGGNRCALGGAGDGGEERLAGRDALPQGREHLGDACGVALARAKGGVHPALRPEGDRPHGHAGVHAA